MAGTMGASSGMFTHLMESESPEAFSTGCRGRSRRRTEVLRMREILFRGKQMDNGERVEGAFCPKSCDDPFGPMVDKPSIIKLDEPNDGFRFDVEPPMKTENGKIIEVTREDLYHMWIAGDWDEFMPFEEYLWRKKKAGVTVKED